MIFDLVLSGNDDYFRLYWSLQKIYHAFCEPEYFTNILNAYGFESYRRR